MKNKKFQSPKTAMAAALVLASQTGISNAALSNQETLGEDQISVLATEQIKSRIDESKRDLRKKQQLAWQSEYWAGESGFQEATWVNEG